MLTRPVRATTLAATLLGAASCGSDVRLALDASTAAADARPIDASPLLRDGDPRCPPPPMPAGPEVELAPEFAPFYSMYELGTVPGVPSPLGGAVVKAGDPSKLLIAGNSENPLGAIYEIDVVRDPCGHIVAFSGLARQVAATRYVDANLVYWDSSLLLYTLWPFFGFAQLPPGAAEPAAPLDLRTLGLSQGADQGPGGLGLVPAGTPGADTERIRMVTWPEGRWLHLEASPGPGGLLTTGALTTTVPLPNNPGGFAYVPPGPPGFPAQSVIVAEWVQGDASRDRVAVYTTDGAADPVVASRKEFFTRFPRPWGAYFEPVTGHYLFLSWGTGTDRVFVVQGFVPPPPIE